MPDKPKRQIQRISLHDLMHELAANKAKAQPIEVRVNEALDHLVNTTFEEWYAENGKRTE